MFFAAAVVAPSSPPPPVLPARVSAEPVRIRGGLGNVLTKLAAGKTVRIAYFGGSITAAGNGWREGTLKWLRETYPKATIEEINAAIGGTGSDLGVYRFRQDVLDKKPDLVFIEFAVNDTGASPENIWRGMEGIVRQAWHTDPTIDLCAVYTFRTGFETDLDKGDCPRSVAADEVLADRYGIPSVNVATKIAEMARAGKLIFVPKTDGAPTPPDTILFSNDGVHPLPAGHALYTAVIADALKTMAATAKPGPHAVPDPLIADHWESARLVPLTPALLSPGWKRLPASVDGLGKQFANRLPQLYEATTPGETLTFTFKGTAAKLYDLLGPDGANAIITVDGVTRPKPSPRFDSYCTYYRLGTMTIAENLPDAVHTVSIRIAPEQPDRSSVTDKERGKPGFDPKRYDGTGMRVGALLLLGDPVEAKTK